MHKRALLATATMLAVALAGCSEEGGSPKPTDDPFSTITTGPVAEGKGLIRGLVIDEAINPIVGATVKVAGHATSTTTSDAGAFLINDLDPGTYFLTVTKPGYGGVQQSAAVVAGVDKPDIVKVLLQRVPGTEPFVVALSFVGYIGCAVKVANVVQDNVCGIAGGIDPDENEVINFGTDRIPELLQTEIVWETTQEFGRQLGTIQYVQKEDGSRLRIGNVWGPSPLICRVTPTDDCTNGDGTGGGGEGLNETGFPGEFWARVYAACVPQCVPGTAVGLGIVLQQEYTLFGTAFFNWLPPAGWSLARDGVPAPP
jgi:hypothetical protein